MKDKTELIRIVKTAEGKVVIGEKIQGRGAYICKSDACMKKAIKSRGLDRSFKSSVSKEIYEQLMRELEEYGK